MKVIKVLMHWSEGWAKENVEFKSIDDFESFVSRNIRPNAPKQGNGYDKTKFTIFFDNGDEYTGRWDVQAEDWNYSIIKQCRSSLAFNIANPQYMGQAYADECKTMLEYFNQ